MRETASGRRQAPLNVTSSLDAARELGIRDAHDIPVKLVCGVRQVLGKQLQPLGPGQLVALVDIDASVADLDGCASLSHCGSNAIDVKIHVDAVDHRNTLLGFAVSFSPRLPVDLTGVSEYQIFRIQFVAKNGQV